MVGSDLWHPRARLTWYISVALLLKQVIGAIALRCVRPLALASFARSREESNTCPLASGQGTEQSLISKEVKTRRCLAMAFLTSS